MNTWRYIPFDTYDGPENMAIDEFLLNSVIEGNCPNCLRFYKWNPSTASIGRNQSLNAEIDLDAASSHNVGVVRRISGGGAVFHDAQGEITYGIICRLQDLPELNFDAASNQRIYDDSIPKRYQIILEALAHGLEMIGIPIDVGRIHCPALLSNGKKISGNAQTLRKNTLLQHGTILLSVQPQLMYTILKAPVGVSYTKMVQSVRAKVTGIHHIQDKVENSGMSEEKIVAALKSGFENIFHINLREQAFSEQEMCEINHLAEKRYKNPDWTNKFP